jgi:hypothetical protein
LNLLTKFCLLFLCYPSLLLLIHKCFVFPKRFPQRFKLNGSFLPLLAVFP